MIRALYIGYTTDTLNHGDEALQWIIRDLLAPEIEVVTRSEKFDVALLGGGTLINQSPWLIDHFAEKLKAAGTGIVFGTGVGDTDFWGDNFAQWIPQLQKCDAVGVRGPVSAQLLEHNGLTGVIDCGDPYLWLNAPVRRQPIPHCLGVNIGSTNNSLWGTNDADLHDFVYQALQILQSRGWNFRFLSVWEKDIPYLSELQQRLGLNDSSNIFDARSEPLESFSMLSGCEVFLGEKLHACAMAAVAGTPFVSLEYQPKVRDFSASLSMDKWTLSTAERDPQKLVNLVEELSTRNDEVKTSLRQTHQHKQKDLLAFAGHVKSIILAKTKVTS